MTNSQSHTTSDIQKLLLQRYTQLCTKTDIWLAKGLTVGQCFIRFKHCAIEQVASLTIDINKTHKIVPYLKEVVNSDGELLGYKKTTMRVRRSESVYWQEVGRETWRIKAIADSFGLISK